MGTRNNNMDTISTWAEVILPLAIAQTYSYAVPEALLSEAQPGCRVEVVFGKNKKYAGIIKSLTHTAPPFKTKPILNVLDDTPLVFEKQLNLWKWISDYYMCSEGEVMAAALPANFKLNSETILLFNEEAGDDFSHLSNDEFIVAEALLIKKQIGLTEVQQLLDSSHVYPVIKKLLEKNICFAWEKLQQRYSEKKENFVLLHPNLKDEAALAKALDDGKAAPKQLQLLLAYLHLAHQGDVIQSDLLKKAGATAAQLKALQQKNIVMVQKRSVDRIPAAPPILDVSITLSESQQHALEAIEEHFKQKNTVLLQGVTGSGKTLIYIKMMASYFLAGKQVLYLLPEIALTAQIIRRLRKHFGGNIAIYHSKFNNQERVELWNKIRTGQVNMVLGPRSALMLPFKDLGLIIIDEEQDASYKQQDPAPRYHARDTAVYYASLFNAKVLMGTATPSVESYYNATQGKYGFVELAERFGGIELPEIEIINLAQVASKSKVMISPQLKEAIQTAISSDKQVILFQNRRGYNPYIICATCGHIPLCTHCDVSLTLHKFSNKLHCHYCGSIYPRLIACPACGDNKWMEKNFGTEKIEEQLHEYFPDYRIARMDIDSIKGKQAHDNLIRQFEGHQLDILVGTQMVVKGLDFEKVTLVGILDADGLLSFADFRVNERAFQLMEQVSGRAGRKHGQGKVMIQALQVAHPVLKWIKEHDFKAFFNDEIIKRREFNYPPFTRIILLTLRHKKKDIVEEAAEKLAGFLKMDVGIYLTGPAEPVIARLRNQYLMEIMIRLPRDSKISAYKHVIRNHIQMLTGEKRFASVQVITDVDPA